MLVVHFVGTPDSSQVEVITIPEEFKALVYKYIVYREVGKAIGGDTYTYEQQVKQTTNKRTQSE